MENQLRLSVLNQMIRDALLDAFPASLWIIAEISEITTEDSFAHIHSVCFHFRQ